MNVLAKDLNAGHIGTPLTVECDGFGATGTLVGVVGYSTSRSVVLHLTQDGCSATITVPYNADITLEEVNA